MQKAMIAQRNSDCANKWFHFHKNLHLIRNHIYYEIDLLVTVRRIYPDPLNAQLNNTILRAIHISVKNDPYL